MRLCLISLSRQPLRSLPSTAPKSTNVSIKLSTRRLSKVYPLPIAKSRNCVQTRPQNLKRTDRNLHTAGSALSSPGERHTRAGFHEPRLADPKRCCALYYPHTHTVSPRTQRMDLPRTAPSCPQSSQSSGRQNLVAVRTKAFRRSAACDLLGAFLVDRTTCTADQVLEVSPAGLGSSGNAGIHLVKTGYLDLPASFTHFVLVFTAGSKTYSCFSLDCSLDHLFLLLPYIGVRGRSRGNTRKVLSLYADGPSSRTRNCRGPYSEGPRKTPFSTSLLWILRVRSTKLVRGRSAMAKILDLLRYPSQACTRKVQAKLRTRKARFRTRKVPCCTREVHACRRRAAPVCTRRVRTVEKTRVPRRFR